VYYSTGTQAVVTTTTRKPVTNFWQAIIAALFPFWWG